MAPVVQVNTGAGTAKFAVLCGVFTTVASRWSAQASIILKFIGRREMLTYLSICLPIGLPPPSACLAQFLPYTQRQMQVSEMVEGVLQAREGLKHHQATNKVQK